MAAGKKTEIMVIKPLLSVFCNYISGRHHVRVCHENDYDRFSRYLSGGSIGLVLSGGGCRGLAHLGLL
jgi:predicted acylesterase/phospholipase RssA